MRAGGGRCDGLYAVLAAASGAGAEMTFVVAVQSLRVVVMILPAPLEVRWMVAVRRRRTPRV